MHEGGSEARTGPCGMIKMRPSGREGRVFLRWKEAPSTCRQVDESNLRANNHVHLHEGRNITSRV